MASVCLLVIVMPRLAALGGYLHMDEGFHELIAHYIQRKLSAGAGFPEDVSGYQLYPILLAWTWNLPGNGAIWMRFCDMLMAAFAGYVFCGLLIRESGSFGMGLILAAAFLAGLNLSYAIDSGCKNSFFPAFFCMFLAAAITVEWKRELWTCAGILCGAAVLLRETFVIFPVMAFIWLACAGNFRAAWRYALGGIIGVGIITVLLAWQRGGFWPIFEAYFLSGEIYAPEAGRVWSKFWQNGSRAAVIYAPLVIMFIVSLCYACRHKGLRGKESFWLACAIAPILEPALKIGFFYHFSVCLPGMALFCANAYAKFPLNGRGRGIFRGGAAFAALIMVLWLAPQFGKLPITLETLASGWDWRNSEELADHSSTVRLARAINGMLPENGTLSASGFAYFIYPASGALPSALSLADLSRAYIHSGRNAEKFYDELKSSYPDVIVLAYTEEDHSATYAGELEKILQEHGEYGLAGQIMPDAAKNYGWLGYKIYARQN